jgi:hypothetical protein
MALREVKEKVIQWINESNERISVINKSLGIEEHLFQPSLVPDEKPESRFIFTKEEVLKFQKEQNKLAKRNTSAHSMGAEEENTNDSQPAISDSDEDDESTNRPKGNSQSAIFLHRKLPRVMLVLVKNQAGRA